MKIPFLSRQPRVKHGNQQKTALCSAIQQIKSPHLGYLIQQIHNNPHFQVSHQLMPKQPNNSSISATGRWTKSEHQLFLKGLQSYGRNWKEISRFVGTRNGAQIRSHAQKYFLKNGLCESVIEQEKTGESSCQKVSPFPDTTFPFEEEIQNPEFSHYFSEISKMVYSNKSFSFWEQFIEVQHLEVGDDHNIWRSQKSFKPYQRVGQEKKALMVKQ